MYANLHADIGSYNDIASLLGRLSHHLVLFEKKAADTEDLIKGFVAELHKILEAVEYGRRWKARSRKVAAELALSVASAD